MFKNFDPVGETIKKCPFLHALVITEGESFARQVATDFSKTEATKKPTATKLEQLQGVAESFTLAHSPQGLLPLPPSREPLVTSTASPQVLRTIPAASLSLSGFWGDFNPFKFNGKKRNDQKKPNRKNVSSSKSQGSSSVHSMASGGTGQCPLRKIFGPFAAVIMNQRYQCPKPVVMMRAAIAKTPIVRALRPESLEIKLLAIALSSALLNIPFGMLREHTRKFSPEWFLVVHATIPFIAMLRKAVVMPPYAILFTVASAIGGQAVGAKAERLRLAWNTSLVDQEENFLLQNSQQPFQVTNKSIAV